MDLQNLITIDTRLITLIGTPLHQSFAAAMQNAAYQAMGEPILYTYTETDDAHLKEIIEGIRYSPLFCGCAVTKPNKVKVMDYLDEVDPLCRRTGACNTVLRTPDNRLIGYNTDAVGFRLSVENETDFCLSGCIACCMGAGGAGRAICFSLAEAGAARIYISDLYPESAESLVRDINRNYGDIAVFAAHGDFSPVCRCSLIINASGIGMGRTAGQSPLPPKYLSPDMLCFDACYNPDKTRFLEEAECRGCRILNGLGMSLHQGAAQIKIWTGRDAPLNVMRDTLLNIIADDTRQRIALRK